jgi:hypothetical protein
MVRMLAGAGEVVRLPGDGHALTDSGDVIWDLLETWLPDVLGVAPAATGESSAGS